MEIVEQIGAYAGFAAVVGLAVLSALYFSQARDVKRLREWAGRAPERAQQPVAPSTVKAQPQPKPAQAKPPAAAPVPQPGKPSTPAGTPAVAPAAATAAGAGPATATQAPPATAKPPAVPKPSVPKPAVKPATTTLPPRPPTVPGRSGVPVPAGRGGPKEPWHRRVHWPAPRYIALLLAGVLVLGGGGAYGVTELLKDDNAGETTAGNGGAADDEDADRPKRKPPRINPSTVTVSVLNGTTVPNLAARLADEAESAGFQRGNTANAAQSRQAKAESVVLYSAGAKDEARLVARRLDISQIERSDAESQALGGNASVIVVVGADQTQ